MTETPPEPNQSFGGTQPPYPGEQPSYGAYPADAAGAPRQAPPAPTQPPSIALAVKLMWAGAAVSLVGLVVAFARLGSMKDDIADQLRKDDPSVSQSTIDAAYTLGIVFAIVIGGVGVLMWAWMAWKNGQGRSWARVVATVLGGLNVVFTLIGFAGQNTESTSIIFSLITLALAVVILILLWKKESTAFYEGHTASRRLY